MSETVTVYTAPYGTPLPTSALVPPPSPWRRAGTATEDRLTTRDGDIDLDDGAPPVFWLTFHRRPAPAGLTAAVIEWVDAEGWTVRGCVPRLHIGSKRDGRRVRCIAAPDPDGWAIHWYYALDATGDTAGDDSVTTAERIDS